MNMPPIMEPMPLADYLDKFSWSQTALARQADVSLHTVARALNGEIISRRCANKIIEALDRKFQSKGAKVHIMVRSVAGLHIAALQGKIKQQYETGTPLWQTHSVQDVSPTENRRPVYLFCVKNL